MKIWKIKARWLIFYRKSVAGRVIAKFVEDRIPQKAAGLAFTTILALVPMLAVFLAFGGYSSIETNLQELVVKSLLPASQEPILQMLNEFALNSRRLGTWGILVSLVIIVLLLNTIERSFNEILRARPSKSFLAQISTYTSSLVFGILIIGASVTITGQSSLLIRELVGTRIGPFQPLLIGLFSIVMVTITLIIMFYIFPSGQIPFRSVIPGAVFGGICWEIAKQLFSLWVGTSVRNSIIYGSLFLLPIFFIWVDVVWIIVLSSLEITYIHQHRTNPRDWERRITLPRQRAILSMEMMLIICRRFQKRQTPPTLKDLCMHLHLSERNVLDLMQPFLRRRFIYATKGRNASFIPGADIHSMELKELLHLCLNGTGKLSFRDFKEAKELWNDFSNKGEEALKGSIGELIQQ